MKFSTLKEGQRFTAKTNTVYTKKTEMVSNAVTDKGVTMRFPPNEEVTVV